MSSPAYEPVCKLAGADAVESFDSGQPALNQFLHRFALVNQQSNSAQTYVCCRLQDAMKRTAQAADIAGIRALLVHAKDDTARRWSLNWELEPSASDSFHLFLLIRDIEALAGKK